MDDYLQSDLFEPLAEFLKEIDLQVGSWICDKQNGFITAISAAFKGISIYLCLDHFLKSMDKPVQSGDTTIGKAIKKLQPLKQLERDLAIEILEFLTSSSM